MKLYLVTTPDGMPVAWCLADPKIGEREVAGELLAHAARIGALRPGLTLIGDKGFAGRDFEDLATAGFGLRLVRPDRKDEAPRHGSTGWIRQWIESVNDTLKGQLDLERHGGRTTEGLYARLPGFGSFASPLGHHPDRALLPGVEISSGSLGHGLPIAVGTALGPRARKARNVSVWVLVGDAEMEEGSNHEAIALAGALGLANLHVVAIDNASATYGWRNGLAAPFAAEGWSAVTVSGRDHAALYQAFATPHAGRPHAVIAQVEPKSA